MDLLLTSWAEDRPPPRRRRRIGGQLREVKEEPKKISTAQLLAYVNMKCTLMFSDLAVGVAIPVYLEVMRVDIGAGRPSKDGPAYVMLHCNTHQG
jgi:hypothetical protein